MDFGTSGGHTGAGRVYSRVAVPVASFMGSGDREEDGKTELNPGRFSEKQQVKKINLHTKESKE